MWRNLIFKVFAARTVCKKQEQKYRMVVKIWVEIPYGVCVYWWIKSDVNSNEKLSVTSVTYVQVRMI